MPGEGTVVKLLLLSDLHLGHPGPPDPLVRLQAALEDIARHHADAAHAVILGDITHGGTPEEYALARQELARLPCPFTVLPGNHDSRPELLAGLPQAPRTASGHVQGVVEVGPLRLVTLDTLDDPPFPSGRDAGFLCPARLAWLEATLAEAPERPTLLFLHHPPAATGIPGMDRIGLRNGAALLNLLARHPQVVHLFSGHQHRAVSGRVAGRPLAVIESVWNQLELNLAPGSRNRFATDAGGAYGVVLARAGGDLLLHRRRLPPV